MDLTHILSLISSLRKEKNASYTINFNQGWGTGQICLRDLGLTKHNKSLANLKMTSHEHETWVMESMNMFRRDEMPWKQV